MFRRNLLLSIIIIFSSTVIFPKSRVIISGRSSIIIESANNNTNLFANKIETVSGGKLIKTDGEDVASDKLSDVSANISDGIPTEFVIGKAYPNPFNPTTTIRYGISTQTPVNVVIYDMTGRLVKDYNIESKTPGWHEFTWQGTDSYEQQVSTGMYLVTMRTGKHFQKQKVTFLK